MDGKVFYRSILRCCWYLLDTIHILFSLFVSLWISVWNFFLKNENSFKKRIFLELKTIKNFEEDSLYHQQMKSQVFIIHFSSEGEWDQVQFIVRDLIASDEKVLLLYSSLSVHEKIQLFIEEYRSQEIFLVQGLLMPLLTRSQFSWRKTFRLLSSTVHGVSFVFTMVRYDFYPLLMIKIMQYPSLLLWCYLNKTEDLSLKKKWSGFFIKCTNAIKLLVLESFTQLVSSNQDTLLKLKTSFLKHKTYGHWVDFRLFTILNKMNLLEKNNHQTFKDLFSSLSPEKEKKEKDPNQRAKIFIHGNAYVDEVLYLLREQNFIQKINDNVLEWWIICHHSKDETRVENLLNQQISSMVGKRVFLLKGRGFLLSCFSFGDFSYVGGSLYQSAHSVLEPFVWGQRTIVGPMRGRSSEYDLAKELGGDYLYSFNHASEFSQTIIKVINSLDHLSKEQLLKEKQIFRNSLNHYVNSLGDDKMNIMTWLKSTH